ncbi:MAG TPA: hypothetical protein VKR58_10865 [Aquella sp.]|nr:hypothetical protein [Aquella sp.]
MSLASQSFNFKYEPFTEEKAEKSRYTLMDAGQYFFEVKFVEAQVSSKGNPMLKLTLAVWDNEGISHNIIDYLVSTPTMAWKIRHFCEAVGLIKEYENGTFNENMCAGVTGKAQIAYQAGKQKPEGGYYSDKNVVEDYLKNEDNTETKPKESKGLNDDLPF